MKKIAIYGHARSGTTSLKCLMDAHSKINKLVYEPLVQERDWTLSNFDIPPEGTVKTKEDRMQFVRDWLEREQSSGFKHLTNTGYTDELVEEFSDFGVLTLYRENLSQAVLSAMMSLHTKAWQIWKIDQHKENLSDLNFEVDFDAFRKITKDFEEARGVVKLIDGFHLVYEDFFLQPMEEKKKTLAEIFDYLGYEPEFNDRMERFLTVKFNTEETYRMVKNIDDVHREFGGIFD